MEGEILQKVRYFHVMWPSRAGWTKGDWKPETGALQLSPTRVWSAQEREAGNCTNVQVTFPGRGYGGNPRLSFICIFLCWDNVNKLRSSHCSAHVSIITWNKERKWDTERYYVNMGEYGRPPNTSKRFLRCSSVSGPVTPNLHSRQISNRGCFRQNILLSGVQPDVAMVPKD